MKVLALKHRSAKLAYLGSGIPALSATFIYREIFELKRRGYEVHVYSIWKPDRASLSAEALPLCEGTHYLQPIRLSTLLRCHFYYVLCRPLRYLRTLWKMLSPFHHRAKDRIRSLMHFGEAIVLARQMELDGITHIHSHYASQPTSVARVVHLLTGISYSFSAHAHDIWEDRILVREKLREARFAVCCSAHGRDELVKQGDTENAAKVRVVYHGLDVRRFVPPEHGSRKSNLILAVGRLDAMKGFDVLLEACNLLKQRHCDFQCRIVGEGEERSRLTKLIASRKLTGLVSLAGAMPQERLLAEYHEAAIFALPCVKTKTNRYDGIPNVLVEAMATGLPVVSTRISGIPELVNHGRDGFLTNSGDPEELAARLEELLRNGELRQRMGEAGRTKVCTHFDNQKCIEALIELFKSEHILS